MTGSAAACTIESAAGLMGGQVGVGPGKAPGTPPAMP
jgi:hypothetical protein